MNIICRFVGIFQIHLASSIVVNVINSFASKYGLASEKGTILGIFRSLQALARAIGPLLASFGKLSSIFNRLFETIFDIV